MNSNSSISTIIIIMAKANIPESFLYARRRATYIKWITSFNPTVDLYDNSGIIIIPVLEIGKLSLRECHEVVQCLKVGKGHSRDLKS